MGERGEDVHQRDGGQPYQAQNPANADGRVAVGAGAPQQDTEALRQQMIEERKQELREIDQELKSLNDEVGSDRPDADQLDYGNHLQADAYIAATELNALENHSYAESFEDFIETNGSMTGSLDAMSGAERLHLARGQSDDFLARASGWDILEVGPADMLGGMGRLGSRAWRRMFGRRKRPSGRLGGSSRRTQERVRGRRKRRRDRRDCKLVGNPAFMPTGIPVHDDPDFEISGLISISLSSSYYGDVNAAGPLGQNRLSDIDATITRNDRGGFTFLDEDGFKVNFIAPTPIPDGWEDGDTLRNIQLMQGPSRSLVLRENNITTHFDKCSDGIWRISRIEDRRGNALAFSRDTQARLILISMPEGLKLHFSYEAGLRTKVELEGIDGSTKLVMRYGYDENRRMIFAESPYGERHEFAYDLEGNLSQVIRNGRYHARFEHDSKGRRVKTKTNRDTLALFQYDDRNKIATFIPGGEQPRSIEFHYNDNYNITREVNALGHVRQFVEDEEGFIAAEIDGEGNHVRYRYDAFGQLKTITDASGRSTYYSWSQDGDLEVVIDNAGKSWDLFYDDVGSLSLIKDPLNYVYEITNNAKGQPTGVMRHDGLIAQNAYDSHHWLAETINFRGGRTRLERDGFGRVTRVVESDGSAILYEYEDQTGLGFSSPTRITREDGVTTQIRVSHLARVVETIDGEGRKSVHEYDGLNNLTAFTDAKGGRVEFLYDDELRLETVVNAAGRKWVFTRDNAGRIVGETDFDGKATAYILDKADRIVEERKADGRRIAYEWDPSGRLLRRRGFLPDRVEATEEESYEYDDVGRLCLARNNQSVIELEYDANGRVLAETTDGVRIENTFDCCGNRTERLIGSHLTKYRFDAMGALTGLGLGSKDVLSIERNRLGRPLKMRGADGLEIEYLHDPLGRVIRQVVSRGRQGKELSQTGKQPVIPDIWSRHFSFDRAGLPTATSDSLWGASRYESDENGQISIATHGLDLRRSPFLARPSNSGVPGFADETEIERFDYAATYEIAASETALPNDPLGRPLNSWKATSGGQVLVAYGPRGERISYGYDDAGRATVRHVDRKGFRRKSSFFTWDTFDRIVGVTCSDGSVWTYQYDAFGRRIEKRQTKLANTSKPRSTPLCGSRFVWDGDVVAAEYPIYAGLESSSCVWWHFEPESFVPILREDGGNRNVLHVLCSPNGMPSELLDSTGKVVWSATYRLWGELRGLWTTASEKGRVASKYEISKEVTDSNGDVVDNISLGMSTTNVESEDDDLSSPAATAASLCPMRFQGQWEDLETGLYYNRFRFYDPLGAHYLSPDPIGLEGGLSSNAYVNNPLFWNDPLGLSGRYPPWMPPTPGFERHHIIPWHLQNDPFLRSIGFDVNSRQNMMYLPRRACSVAGGGTSGQRGSAQHRGFNGHDQYNNYMSGQLRNLERRTNNMSKRCKVREVRRFQLAHRTMLGTGAMQIANCK